MIDNELQTGVHRGRVNPDMTIQEVIKALKKHGLSTKVYITGSLAEEPKGSKQNLDVDVAAKKPTGISSQKLNKIERQIQDETGADFSFEDD